MKTAIIGLGKKNIEDHLPAVLAGGVLHLDSICDPNEEQLHKLSKDHKVDGFKSVDDLLKAKKPDIAIVAVPHDEYKPIIKSLAYEGVHIIKEKPLARNMEEAIEIDNIIRASKILMMLTLQRRFNPIFQAFCQLRKRIGKIFSFEGRYTMNINRLDLGWRASKDKAGGGALIDMGYHYIDLLVWYFGLPRSVATQMTTHNREGQQYDVEDTAHMLFDYDSGIDHHEKMTGHTVISRTYPRKEEKLEVLGTKGVVLIERGKIIRFDNSGNEVDRLERIGSWQSAAIEQLEYFADLIKNRKIDTPNPYREHFAHMAIVEAAYRSDNSQKQSFSPLEILQSKNISL